MAMDSASSKGMSRGDGMGTRGGAFGANRDGGAGNRFNSRYESRPIASAPFTGHNMLAMGNALAPGGMFRTAAGIGPQYEGVKLGGATMRSYDPTNRAMQPGGPMGAPQGGVADRLQGAGLYRGGTNQTRPMTANLARAQALQPAKPRPTNTTPMPSQNWWRTPFPTPAGRPFPQPPRVKA